MKKSRIPTTEIPIVDHAMNVWIGVKPLGRVQVEAVGEVERRQDHVQRRDGEPAEPVRPRGDRR